MKNKTKKICKILIKLLVGFLGLLILSFILVAIYSFTYEKDKIAIDKYNFEQRDKVKTIIYNDKYYNIAFRDIKQFNRIYNSDIMPIKNCYYLSDYNGDEKYIFGFKIESLLYKILYNGESYAYPKYDIKNNSQICVQSRNSDTRHTGSCYLKDYWKEFVDFISNPCEE